MTGNLIDAEGFPRADIDVHGVRTQRNRYAILRTDHQKILAEIEKYLHLALAPPANRGEEAGSSEAAPTGPSATEALTAQPETAAAASAPAAENGPTNSTHVVPRRPAFALVDIVTENSPAATAGLLVNDKIVSFGAVSLRSFASPELAMGGLPGLLREHENQPLDVIIERGDGENPQIMTLSLTPKRWSGVGLLGCHVVPLEISQIDSRYAPEVATAFMQHSRPGHV